MDNFFQLKQFSGWVRFFLSPVWFQKFSWSVPDDLQSGHLNLFQKSRMVPCFMYKAVFRGSKPAWKQRIWLVDHMETKNIIMHFNRPRSKWKDRHRWLMERSGNGLLLYVPVHLITVMQYEKSYGANIWWIVIFEAFGS